MNTNEMDCRLLLVLAERAFVLVAPFRQHATLQAMPLRDSLDHLWLIATTYEWRPVAQTTEMYRQVSRLIDTYLKSSRDWLPDKLIYEVASIVSLVFASIKFPSSASNYCASAIATEIGICASIYADESKSIDLERSYIDNIKRIILIGDRKFDQTLFALAELPDHGQYADHLAALG